MSYFTPVRIPVELFHQIKEHCDRGDSVELCIERLLTDALIRSKQPPASTWPPAVEKRMHDKES